MESDKSAVVALTDASFASEVSKSKLPVMVDFWADWCVPCKSLLPAIEELATKYKGQIKICKINVSENQKIASEYGINSVPVILFFREGKVSSAIYGVNPKSYIENIIKQVID